LSFAEFYNEYERDKILNHMRKKADIETDPDDAEDMKDYREGKRRDSS